MIRQLLFFIVLIVSVGLISDVAEGRQLVRSKSLSAHVTEPFKCNRVAALIIEAPDVSFYSKDNRELQRLVGSARAILGFECGKIERILILGKVNGVHVYDGRSSKQNNWAVVRDRLREYSPKSLKSASKKKKNRSKRNKTAVIKAWEADDIIRKKYGQFHVSLQKNFSRNAGEGEFAMHVTLANERRVTVIVVDFRHSYSVCSEVMDVDIAADTRPYDFAKFRKSHKGQDLPPKIKEALKVAREILCEQCEQMEVLRFSFDSRLISAEERALSYKGTTARANGWIIQDGVVQTAHDTKRKIILNTRGSRGKVGIDYKGACEEYPVLPLAPIYKGKFDRKFSDPPKMNDYKHFAKVAAKLYLEECPGTETISYSIHPIPRKYYCPENQTCYLTWDASYPSNVNTAQFIYKTKPKKVDDYNDIIELLAGGDFDILKDYDDMVHLFYNDFVEKYSDNCKAQIHRPVTREVEPIETRYTQIGDGGRQGKGGTKKLIYVDPKFADRFDEYYQPNIAWGKAYLMTRVSQDRQAGNNQADAIKKHISFFLNNRKQLDKLFSGTSMSRKGYKVCNNLYRYCHNADPMKH